MEQRSTSNDTEIIGTGIIMSLNPTFDDVLALTFGTLDAVYSIHAPEKPEDDNDPGNCVHCEVAFPCDTADTIMNGLAHIANAMTAVKEAEATSSSSPQSE
jgi:hypothetical protein